MNLLESLAGIDEVEAVRPRFVIRNAADALKPQPPIAYLVDKLITTSSLSMFFGEPGSKKTYSLMDLAVCAAAGKDWLEFGIAEPVKVLIIDEESGERRMAMRLAAALKGELATEIDPTYLVYVSLAGFDLGEKKDAGEVSKLIMDVGAQIVIIDALADIMSGDENSKQDTQPVMNHLRKIAEDTDSAIILIHHSNKAGGYRGTSAIKGALDLQVKVESDNDSQFVNFTTEKNRDGEPINWAGIAVWGAETFSMSPAEKKEKAAKLTSGMRFVLRYLRDNGDKTVGEITDAAEGCSPGTAKNALYDLADPKKSKLPEAYTRRIDSGPAGGNGSKATYGLTEAGKNAAKEL